MPTIYYIDAIRVSASFLNSSTGMRPASSIQSPLTSTCTFGLSTFASSRRPWLIWLEIDRKDRVDKQEARPMALNSQCSRYLRSILCASMTAMFWG